MVADAKNLIRWCLQVRTMTMMTMTTTIMIMVMTMMSAVHTGACQDCGGGQGVGGALRFFGPRELICW